jgi:hypothetical protein
VHVGKLAAQGEPATLVELRSLVDAMMPRVDLPELILEVHAWTGCLDAYTHISEAYARMDDLALSVAACLVAEGCNLGYSPVIDRGHRLSPGPGSPMWIRTTCEPRRTGRPTPI